MKFTYFQAFKYMYVITFIIFMIKIFFETNLESLKKVEL